MADGAQGINLRGSVSAEEWKARVDLAAMYRLVALHGWDDMIFTHISHRVPGPDHHFLINPYGMLFEEITASSLVKIDLDGNVIQETEYFINPAGFTIHSAVHAARDDAHVVMHLHTDDGVAVSCQKDGLMPLSQTSMQVRALSAGRDGVIEASEDVQNVVKGQSNPEGTKVLANRLAWPALLRKLDRQSPGYDS